MNALVDGDGILRGRMEIEALSDNMKGLPTLVEYAELFGFPLRWVTPNKPTLDLKEYQKWCAENGCDPERPQTWSRHHLENLRDKRRIEKIRAARKKTERDGRSLVR